MDVMAADHHMGKGVRRKISFASTTAAAAVLLATACSSTIATGGQTEVIARAGNLTLSHSCPGIPVDQGYVEVQPEGERSRVINFKHSLYRNQSDGSLVLVERLTRCTFEARSDIPPQFELLDYSGFLDSIPGNPDLNSDTYGLVHDKFYDWCDEETAVEILTHHGYDVSGSINADGPTSCDVLLMEFTLLDLFVSENDRISLNSIANIVDTWSSDDAR